MKTLIRMITLKHLTLQPLRSALMITGIALGVSVFVGVRALNETTLHGFKAVFSAASQNSDLIVEGSRNGLDQSLIGTVLKNPSVESAAPILVNYARPTKNTKTPNTEKTSLSSRRYLVLGLDLLSESTKKVYGLDDPNNKNVQISNPMVLAMNPQAILVSESFSQRESLKPGEKLSFFTSAGQRQFLIAGTYKENKLSQG
ncbi:MAG: ABC transporter permease, partial [Planctomycetota bacterium]|nr:ABC transporter permease [Planctomycetota bacterium]